ncbi:MAG: M12 family metallo-peptidase [Polyangiales bacterium]
MQTARRWVVWWWVVGLTQLACGCTSTPRELFVRQVDNALLPALTLELAAGAETRLRLRTLGGGATPVLHVWDPEARREVARAQGLPWLGRSVELTLRNPQPVSRRYELLAHAREVSPGARAELTRDGSPWQPVLPLSAAALPTRSALGWVHQAAASPAGPHRARLYGLDKAGHIVASDEASGPTGLPRLAGAPEITSLLLLPSDARGPLRLYTNDLPSDRDHDGLGRRLERALGTCDDPEQAGCHTSLLTAFYRQVGTRDTDRDGLSDGDEVFGVSAPLLDLPRFGVDPRHKDVLVELDAHERVVDGVGFSEADLALIGALFANGSATSLRNPDGLPGVRLHIDAGFAPSEPAHASLFGAFGGSSLSHSADYRAARKRDFSAARSGYFRYAFSTRRGRGQAHGDAFTVNRDLTRVTIFAHELGHTLGLSHHGHDSWGKVNCKPNYQSIMNYLYQSRSDVGFSRRAPLLMNPASVRERGGARDLDRAWLRDPPLELDVFAGRDVDWNRNGAIDDGYVRAGVTWGTYKSCNAGEVGVTELARGHLATATPLLLMHSDHATALWLDDNGQLWSRRGTPNGAALSWSTANQLQSPAPLRHVSGVSLPEGRAVLALVQHDGGIQLAAMAPGGQQLTAAATIPNLHTAHGPSVWLGTVDPQRFGASHALRLLVRATDGGLWQVDAADVAGPLAVRRALDDNSLPLTASGAVAAAELPTHETCAVVPDARGELHVYLYDHGQDRWRDFSRRVFDNGVGPRTHGQVSLAYHVFRDASGAPSGGDATRGSLLIGYTEPPDPHAPLPDIPHLLRSEWLSRTHGAAEQLSLRWRGSLISEWSTVAAGSGVALAEAPTELGLGLSGLLVVRDDTKGAHVDFLPHVDGEVDAALGGGDDFAVMERGICLGLHTAAVCGDASTAVY